jgi:hypothetical protein
MKPGIHTRKPATTRQRTQILKRTARANKLTRRQHAIKGTPKRTMKGGFVRRIKDWWARRKANTAAAKQAGTTLRGLRWNTSRLLSGMNEYNEKFFKVEPNETLYNKVMQKKDNIYINESIFENEHNAKGLYAKGVLGIVFRDKNDIDTENPTFKLKTKDREQAITQNMDIGNIRIFMYNSLSNLIKNYNDEYKYSYNLDNNIMFKFIVHQDRIDNIDYFKNLSSKLPTGYIVSDVSAITKFNTSNDLIIKLYKKYVQKYSEYVFMVYKRYSEPDIYMAYNNNDPSQGIPMNEEFFKQKPDNRFSYLVFFTNREHKPLPPPPTDTEQSPPSAQSELATPSNITNNNIAPYLTGKSNNNRVAQKTLIKLSGGDSMKLKVLTRESLESMAIYPIRMPLINVTNTANILNPGTGIYLNATSANTPFNQLIVCYKDAESNIKQLLIQPNTINGKPDYVSTPINNEKISSLPSEIVVIIGQANPHGLQVGTPKSNGPAQSFTGVMGGGREH